MLLTLSLSLRLSRSIAAAAAAASLPLLVRRALPSLTRTSLTWTPPSSSLRSTLSSTASTASPHPTQEELLAPGTILRCDSGQDYKIEQVLSDRLPYLFVYRASHGTTQYIAKKKIKGEFDYQMELQGLVSSSPNVRTVVDSNQEHEIFIYPFFHGDLLQLSQRKLAPETRKDILRSALRGLIDLHAKHISHNDIKPNNILLNYKEGNNVDLTIKSVQISDLDDSVILSPKGAVKGHCCGNQIWRSPEAWARARQSFPSDVFSFAIVMIYVVTDRMVFHVGQDLLNAEDSWRHILRRHLSYFGDEDGFNGYMDHIGEENPVYDRMMGLMNDFLTGDGLQSFGYWVDIDPTFRDLIVKMTRLDPALRITAQQAIDHPWFSAT
ncbi:kinase-like domain-containing protein [Xylaria castorea]|nr:kinase-like domain-containing protein [Xylaria castorea]